MVSKSGLRSSEIHTVGGAKNFVTRSVSIVCSTVDGFGAGRTMLVAPT
ncbi:MAG TPA: hypothetical protein VGL26_09105 [Jatrophihabitans sp.]